MGAWIETLVIERVSTEITSHPTWVRGLKQVIREQLYVERESHPTWVRGLKL